MQAPPQNMWLEVVKAFGPVVGPSVAFLGAVWLYFRKIKDDREEVARGKRAPLYDEYISTINNAIKLHSEESLKDGALAVALALVPLHGRISVVSPPEVVDASFKYIEALVSVRGTAFEAPRSQVKEPVDLLAHAEQDRLLGNARQHVINIFRQDIYPGSRDIPSAMMVKEAPEDSILYQYSAELERRTAELKRQIEK